MFTNLRFGISKLPLRLTMDEVIEFILPFSPLCTSGCVMRVNVALYTRLRHNDAYWSHVMRHVLHRRHRRYTYGHFLALQFVPRKRRNCRICAQLTQSRPWPSGWPLCRACAHGDGFLCQVNRASALAMLVTTPAVGSRAHALRALRALPVAWITQCGAHNFWKTDVAVLKSRMLAAP